MVDLSKLTPEVRERSRAEFMDRLRARVLASVTPAQQAQIAANVEQIRRQTEPGHFTLKDGIA